MKIGYVSCNYKAGSPWRSNFPIEINMDKEAALAVHNILIEKAKEAMNAGDYEVCLDLLKGVQDIAEALEELEGEIREAQEEEECDG